MTSLWADGWFYISAVGLLVSGALFVYLWGQYRSSLEAPDEAAASQEPLPEPAQTPSATPVVPAGPELEEELGPRQRGAAGLEPPAAAEAAPAFPQELSERLERLAQAVAELQVQACRQSAQQEHVLQRLAQIAEALRSSSPSSASVETAPAPEPSRPPRAAEEPAVVEAAPEARTDAPREAAPAAVSQDPVLAPDQAAAAVAENAVPAPAPAGAEAEQAPPQTPEAAQPLKPRKGPVWPV